MIRLETVRGDLDLNPDTVIDWYTVNPFFVEDDSFTPQFSLPFSLPLTDTNRDLLNFPEQLQVTVLKRIIKVTLYVQGVLMLRGVLNILKAGSRGYTVSLSYDKSVIDTAKSIREFSYGGARAGAADAAQREDDNNTTYPFVDYVWPQVYNREEKKNDGFSDSEILINDFHGMLPPYNDTELATPMPFLNYTIKQLCNELSLKAEGSFFEEAKNKIIYNPVVCNITGTEGIKISQRFDTGKHAWKANEKHMEIRIYDATTFYNVNTGGVLKFSFYEFSTTGFGVVTQHNVTYTILAPEVGNPQILLTNLWTAISALSANIQLVAQDWADPDNPWILLGHVNMVFFSFGPIDYDVQIKYTPINSFTYNDVEVAKHLPDMKVNEFFNAVKNGFKLSMFLNTLSSTMHFVSIRKQLETQEYVDYTPFLLSGHEKEFEDIPDYRFVFENDKEDQNTQDEETWYATNHSEYNKKGYQEVKIPLATLKMEGDFPEVKQKLYKYSDLVTPKFSLRLLTWQGMVIVSGNPTPVADDEGLTPDEMFTNHFKHWYRAIKLGRSVFVGEAALTMEHLANFNPEAKWKLYHNKYVWKEIRTPITMTGIGISKILAIPVPANANIYNTEGGEALPPE